jgi:hypothetical protein
MSSRQRKDGRIWRWTRQNGPVGPFVAGSVHTDSTRPTTLARRQGLPGRPSCRRSSEKWIPTVCSNPKSALGVPATPEPRTSLASPICPPRHGRHARDGRGPGTAIWCSSPPRMRPDLNRRTTVYRSATTRPSGLQRARRLPIATAPGSWRRALHLTVVGRGRPATTRCRDFALNRSACWMQLT